MILTTKLIDKIRGKTEKPMNKSWILLKTKYEKWKCNNSK